MLVCGEAVLWSFNIKPCFLQYLLKQEKLEENYTMRGVIIVIYKPWANILQ